MTSNILLSVANSYRMPIRDKSVHCCVTSPPYFGLRKYSGDQGFEWPSVTYTPMSGLPSVTVEGMRSDLGLEPTPEAFVAHVVAIFREVWRVLRDDGTCWLNFGDSYAGSGKGQMGSGDASDRRGAKQGTSAGTLTGGLPVGVSSNLKPKDLIGIPWRVAFALQADGWYLRSDIIWKKNNPMPESVTDRCTKSHEHLFMLAKSKRYFYDAEAVKEPVADSTIARLTQPSIDKQIGSTRVPGKTNGNMKAVGATDTRNKRDVWTIHTQSFRGAHFATFPAALVEPCILAGTSARGICPECESPWERVVSKGMSTYAKIKQETGHNWSDMQAQAEDNGTALKAGMPATGSTRLPNGTQPHLESATSSTIGWRPTCSHYDRYDEWINTPRRKRGESDESLNSRRAAALAIQVELVEFWADAITVPAVVLDHFCGSGTTGQVSKARGRRFIGLDMSVLYLADIATKRVVAKLPKAMIP